MEPQYELVLPFTDGSPSFCNGFEAGQIWADLRSWRQVARRTVHYDNYQQLVAMARSLDLQLEWDEIDDQWIEVTFCPTKVIQSLRFALRWLTW